jgi:hypothetical protein
MAAAREFLTSQPRALSINSQPVNSYHRASVRFSRRDGIVLGGTFEPDNYSLEPDAKTTARIVEGHAEIAKGLRH